MKVLEKQIKLTKIGTYIKKNDLKWLLFLILPLFLGLIMHFLIPITFVLNANPTAESNYNHQKLTLQQQTVRSLSLINSQIIRMKLQRYENTRNFLIRIFGETNPYQKIIPTQISLNNAYQIAQMANNGTNISNLTGSSMWFAQGKSSLAQLNSIQQYVYGEYLSVQPFIRTQFININNSTQQSLLKGFTISVNYTGEPLYFAYPTSFKSQFLSLNTSCYDKYYNQTMFNYFKSNKSFQYDIFSQNIDGENQIVICNLIFSKQSPAGVACFYILLTDIAQQLTMNLHVPNISYSTTAYYLLTPIYPSFQLKLMTNQPQIIFNFTDKTSQNISYPLNSFLQLPQNIDSSLYIPTPGQHSQNYSIYVTFDSAHSIYFQVPINIFSYTETKETILFLLIKYNFQGSVFNSIAKFEQILKDLSIPSSIVILLSTFISLITLKYLLNSLDDQLHKVNNNCQFLLHGDLDLKIPEYENTQQLKSVYKHLRIVNCLHKFSSPAYFMQPPQKQIIKLFRVLQIFKQLNYPTDTVLENIADSYLMMGEIFKAIQFITQSYDLLVKEVEELFQENLTDILRLKHKENRKLSKSYRRFQLKIIARLFKLILIYSFLLIPPPQVTFHKSAYTSSDSTKKKIPQNIFQSSQKKMRRYLQIFKRLAYPNFVTSESAFAYLFQARFQIDKNNIKGAKTILKRFQRIMGEYGNEFESLQSMAKEDSPVKTYQQMKNNLSSYCKISPNILWSAYYFVQGLYRSEQPLATQQISQIVSFFKKAVQGNTFSQDIHQRVLFQMIKLSYQYNIDQSTIKNLFQSFSFFKQIYPLYHIQSLHNSSENLKMQVLSRVRKGLQKEVIFMFDCSNKWINKLEEFRKWQKQARQLSGKIFNYLQPEDRVSILKVNSSVYVSTCCNLNYKKGNQSLITKELSNAIKLKFMSGKCKIMQGMKTAVNRVKLLEEEKYILVFLKENKESLLSPRGNGNETERKGIETERKGIETERKGNETERKESLKKQKKMSGSSSMLFGGIRTHNFNDPKKLRKNTQASPYHKQTLHSKNQSNMNSLQLQQEFGDQNSGQFFEYYKYIREQILALLLTPQLLNLKLILVTNNRENFIRKFNLFTVNSTLERQFMKRTVHNNNSFLVVEYQSGDDVERIFKAKNGVKDTQTVLSMF